MICGPIWRALLLLAALSPAIGRAQPAPPLAVVDPDTYLRPAQMVAVDGSRRLNLICMGKGSPTVVLESGAGDGAGAWWKVQAEVAKLTRVCAYDRAGYGMSDPITRPVDADRVVADLRRLLRRAGVGGRIVLVGHSLGGLYAELYAGRHARQVAGMVLVDPAGLDDFRLVRSVITQEERASQREAFLKRTESYARCLDLAARGEAAVSQRGECAPAPTGVAVLDQEQQRRFAKPKYWAAYKSEMASFWPSNHPDGVDSIITRQVRSRPLRLGDKPLIILRTPGRVPPGERGERLRTASLAVDQKLALASTRGRLELVTSGHYVQVERPELVIGAIREVVDAVRGQPSH